MPKYPAFWLVIIFQLVSSCTNAPNEEAATANFSVDLDPLPIEATSADTVHFDSTNYTFKENRIVLDWQLLSQVTFTEQFNDTMGVYIPYPDFSANIRAIDGMPVEIKGYVIPVQETGNESIIILSALPYSNCFFCGGAGPETVMDIQLKESLGRRLQMDEQVTFKGQLRLNDSDLYYLNYILDQAEILK